MGSVTEARFKIADESNNTTTLDDVNDMSFEVAPNQEYSFEFEVPHKSGATTTGIGLAVSCPTLDGSAYLAYEVQIPSGVDGTSQLYSGAGTASDDVVQAPGVPAADTVLVARVYGVLKNGSNAGQLKLRFKSENTVAVTIMEGTFGNIFVHPV